MKNIYSPWVEQMSKLTEVYDRKGTGIGLAETKKRNQNASNVKRNIRAMSGKLWSN